MIDAYEYRPMTPEEAEAIEAEVSAYADSMAPEAPHTAAERLVFKVEDERGQLAGGCIVNVHAWGRAVLACLWVDAPCRGQGLGSLLIRRAEQAARDKGCYYLCLGTMDFQARPLYEKHGFTVFTTTEDHPKGHCGWSLSKRLDRGAPDYVPKNNSAAARFAITPGTREDAGRISGGLDRYCERFAPEEGEDLELNRKLVDPDGRRIAGVVAEIDGWRACDVDSIFVEAAYRNRGLGARLLRELEREAKACGATTLLANACDWNVDFFRKCGFTVRGELADYPKGHRAYELGKRL